MNKTLILLPIIFSIIGCDVQKNTDDKNDGGYTPDYINNAKSDLRNAIMADLIKNPDLECNSLILSQQVYWSIACYIPDKKPMPFLLYEVQSDPSESNPPFKYKLIAVNGKAKQYSSNKALRFFNIDTNSNSDINIDAAIEQYLEKYPPKQ